MPKKKQAPALPKPVSTYMTDLLGSYELFNSQNEAAMKVRYTPAEKEASKVILVYGDNASGKSLFRRLYASYVRGQFNESQTVEPLEVSMRTRAGGGMRASFMYGPCTDQDNSSGAVSLGPINGLYCTAAGREHFTIVSLDEAEVGLCSTYHFALGQYLAQRHVDELQELQSHLTTIIVTHSVEMAKGVIDKLGYVPHLVALGGLSALPFNDWLDGKAARKSIEDLKGLQSLNRERHRAFEAFFSKD